jgi:NAD(P)H-hydrate epimerase
MEIPSLTTNQMREVDRLMVETYGIALIQVMENAGHHLAQLARRMVGGNAAGKVVIVLCGPGNNGGGGMAAARHLHNWGADVQVRLAAEPARLREVPAHQWAILKALGLDHSGTTPRPADLVLDALLGYGVSGAPRPPVANLIRWANEQPAPVLALDVPSGLDATSGTAYRPTVRATATLTLALPKTALRVTAARAFVGDLYLADIGVPAELYAAPSLRLSVGSIFARKSSVRVE